MARGGSREGAGRPKGAKAVLTEEAIRKAGVGETPLEYALRIMRDANEASDRRDKMCLGAMPFMHAKAIEVGGPDGGNLIVEIANYGEADTASE